METILWKSIFHPFVIYCKHLLYHPVGLVCQIGLRALVLRCILGKWTESTKYTFLLLNENTCKIHPQKGVYTHCWFMLTLICRRIIPYISLFLNLLSFSQPILWDFVFPRPVRNTTQMTTHMHECISNCTALFFFRFCWGVIKKKYVLCISSVEVIVWFFFNLYPPIAHSLNRKIMQQQPEWQHLHIDVIFDTFVL